MRIALAFLLSVGCVASSNDDGDTYTGGHGGTGTGSGSGSGSGSMTMTPPAPVANGAYSVRSDIDLTVEALLPETAAGYVSTLRDFHNNPARTLFDLAEDAGVPAVAEVRDALPSYVEEKLEGWINDEIAKLTINGVKVTDVAGSVVALAETALTQFAIDSELTIAAGTATHTLKTLDLTPAGLESKFALDTLPAEITSKQATCSTASGKVSIGDHAYSINYGEYVWQAIDAQLASQYGMNIRATLGTAVNCPALADTIGSKCVWGYCVGHETQLTAICERGLDEAVARAYAKVAAMKFEMVHFAAGNATLVDANKDGVAEAMTGGVWTAEINAGMGLRTVPATFTATK